MDSLLCQRDSGVVQFAPSDGPLREHCDQAVLRGRGRNLRGSRSCRRVRGRGAKVSRLEDEDIYNSSPKNESGRGIDTGVLEPEMGFMGSHLSKMAQRSGLSATDDSVETENSRLLEYLNLYKMKNEQLKSQYWKRMPR